MAACCACFCLVIAQAGAAIVNFTQDSVNDMDASTTSAVVSDEFLESSFTYSTLTAPVTDGTLRFTHWRNSSYPAEAYRDAWGRSLNPISFVLLEDTTTTAHYLPAAHDSDTDNLPDWYEIEYFGDLAQAATSDSDGDSITLADEFSRGTHPLFAESYTEGGAAWADSDLITFNASGYANYTLRSDPAGTVDESAVVPPDTLITSPDLASNPDFAYWELDGVRQQDAWGVALTQIEFIVDGTDREGVAYLISGDGDGDGVPDAYEQFYLGALDNGAASDSDGDGLTLLQEYTGGSLPQFAESHSEGGVAWSDSAPVDVNFGGFSRYTLSSDPTGMIYESQIVNSGTQVTTPSMDAAGFAYWELDGVRQQDAWGVALREISFVVEDTDRTAVAYFFGGDSDGDLVDDSYEWFIYGTLANDGASDTDGDGSTLLEEFTNGTLAHFAESHLEGGVAWADSEMLVVNLQPYERLSKQQVDGVLVDFFSPDPDVVSGMQFATWSAPAAADLDGDGDFDLLVADEGGAKLFRNIGSAGNPNFEEVETGLSGLASYIASIDLPIVAGGDWNGDGIDDLVIGGNTGTLRLIASAGDLASDGSGVDLATGSTKSRPALGDMDGDGLVDLLVLLDDGTVRFYTNNELAVPFAAPGVDNFLGTAVPLATSISTGDLNNDGFVDLLLADEDGRIWEFTQEDGGGFLLRNKVWGGSGPGFANGLTI